MLMYVTVKVYLSFLTSSPSLVIWGFIRAAISTNLFTGHLRHSSLKALKQHSCFSILFLSSLYVMYCPAFRDSKAQRKGLERRFHGKTSPFMEFKILMFLQKYRNENDSSKCADGQRGAEGSQLEKFYWMYISYQTLNQYISMPR